MSKKQASAVSIPEEVIISKIYLIRNHKVMIDSDLAELYGVETKRLNEQIKRNQDRFPDDFMFTLTAEEWQDLKSHFATSTGVPAKSWGGRRKLPSVFTEHGVLMLSSVLNSEQAIKTNIQIMRIYTKMRQMLVTHQYPSGELDGDGDYLLFLVSLPRFPAMGQQFVYLTDGVIG